MTSVPAVVAARRFPPVLPLDAASRDGQPPCALDRGTRAPYRCVPQGGVEVGQALSLGMGVRHGHCAYHRRCRRPREQARLMTCPA